MRVKGLISEPLENLVNAHEVLLGGRSAQYIALLPLASLVFTLPVDMEGLF